MRCGLLVAVPRNSARRRKCQPDAPERRKLLGGVSMSAAAEADDNSSGAIESAGPQAALCGAVLFVIGVALAAAAAGAAPAAADCFDLLRPRPSRRPLTCSPVGRERTFYWHLSSASERCRFDTRGAK